MKKFSNISISKVNTDGRALYEFIDNNKKHLVFLEKVCLFDKVSFEIDKPYVVGSLRYPSFNIKINIKSFLRAQKPFCLHQNECGACSLCQYSYLGSLKVKKYLLNEALSKTKLTNIKVLPFFPLNDNDAPCRFKSIRFFCYKNDKIELGFYKQNTHQVLPISFCVLEDNLIQDICNCLCKFANENKLTVYDEEKKVGLLRAAVLRVYDKSALVTLVVSHKIDRDLEDKFKTLFLNQSISFYLCINDTKNNDILSSNIKTLQNSNFTVILDKFSFKVSPLSFMQVNYKATSYMYQKAVSLCNKYAKSHDYALDLCCGVGTISMYLSSYFKNVLGVEIVESAIVSAKENALLNKIENTSFIAGDITKIINKILDNKKVDAIIADPSRRGLGSNVINALGNLTNLCLCVIFCSSKTMSKEVPMLVNKGYKVELVEGIDMFKFSSHFETLVLFTKSE